MIALLSRRFALLCFLRFLTIRRRWHVVKHRGLEMKRSMTCCRVTAGILVKGFYDHNENVWCQFSIIERSNSNPTKQY